MRRRKTYLVQPIKIILVDGGMAIAAAWLGNDNHMNALKTVRCLQRRISPVTVFSKTLIFDGLAKCCLFLRSGFVTGPWHFSRAAVSTIA